MGGGFAQRRLRSDRGEEEGEKKATPFNVQMFESITARVEKEKQELIRASQLQQQTAVSKFVRTMFGMPPLLSFLYYG